MFTIFGWAGMVTFLVGYWLVSPERLPSSGWVYNLMQALAALAFVVSLLPVWRDSLPVIGLELVFVVIGAKAILKAVKK
jgi:hypothetical protein